MRFQAYQDRNNGSSYVLDRYRNRRVLQGLTRNTAEVAALELTIQMMSENVNENRKVR